MSLDNNCGTDESGGQGLYLFIRGANLHACAPHARCKQRSCPTCRAIKRKKVGDEIYRRTTDLPTLHVTLTAPSSYEPLRQQITSLKASMAHLRRLAYWRKNVIGGEYCIDQTYNAVAQAYHLHAHLIVVSPPLEVGTLSALWASCTNGADHVHVADLTQDDEYRLRAAHYGLKPLHGSIENDPTVRADFFKQTAGLRLFGTFGDWRGRPLLPKRRASSPPQQELSCNAGGTPNAETTTHCQRQTDDFCPSTKRT